MELKLSRAKEHLDLVKQEAAAFTEANRETLRLKIDDETGYPHIHSNVPPMPERLGVLAADFFTCLRSSLDYLAWQLSTNRTQDTAFPILKKKPDEGFHRKTKKSLSGIPGDAVRVIESLQPYHRGKAAEDDFLWIINRFANISKHCFVPASGSARRIEWESIPAGTTFRMLDNNNVVLEYPEGRLDEVKLKPDAGLHVIFGEAGGIQAELGDLSNLYKFVRDDIVPRFASYFPKSKGS